jgi:hypothetical protein
LGTGIRSYPEGLAIVDADTQTATLPAPVLDFIGAVDVEMVKIKARNAGKTIGRSVQVDSIKTRVERAPGFSA